MMQDYDKKHWTTNCPKVNCREKSCKCGLKYVFIAATLGGDEEGSSVAPKNGAYCNAIVEYEATGSIYIYSAEGIPVLVEKGGKVEPISVRIVVDTSHETATYTSEEEGYALTARTFTTDPTGYEQYVTITVDGAAYEEGMLLQAGEHQVVYTLADGEGYTGDTANYSITVTQTGPTPTEDWGSIVYYNSWYEGYKIDGDRVNCCEVELIDPYKLKSFVEAHGGFTPSTDSLGNYFWYYSRYDEQTEEYIYYWKYHTGDYTDGTEILNSEMEELVGVRVIHASVGSEEGTYFAIEQSTIADKDGGTSTYNLTRENWTELRANEDIYSGESFIPILTIKEIRFGEELTDRNIKRSNGKSTIDENWTALEKVDLTSVTNITNLGTHFCSGTYLTELVGLELTSITSIGDDFLSPCRSFNQPLTIPSSVTSIGNRFLYECSSFNQSITIPDSVTSIGDSFLSGCSSFNQSITIPDSVTSIGGSFLDECSSFNQSITIPDSVTSIGYSFLSGCSSFNQPITIPDSVTSIENSFLSNCSSFNQELILSSNLAEIDSYFLNYCAAFNQDLTLPDSLTTIGGNFMDGCDAYVSTVNVGSIPASVIGQRDYDTFSTENSEAPCYTTGITIVGTYVADWVTNLPDLNDWPYRKIINGGTSAP